MPHAFDILRKLSDGGIVWITSARDLETARERVKVFANYKPGEYVIFSQETQSVVKAPCVPFVRDAVETTDCRSSKKKGAKKKPQRASSATLTTEPRRVIADIVADIEGTLRHKQ